MIKNVLLNLMDDNGYVATGYNSLDVLRDVSKGGTVASKVNVSRNHIKCNVSKNIAIVICEWCCIGYQIISLCM